MASNQDRAAAGHVLTERLGRLAVLDKPAKAAGKKLRSLYKPGLAREALSGAWLGHSLHPLLTDVVIGTWTSALFLDLTGSEGDGAERLIAAGLAAYPPTAASGGLDWADSEAADDGIRRIGAVHFGANLTAFGLQAASLRARRRGEHGRGVALSLAGAGALTLGGYLGAHLSYARGVGVNQTAFDEGPADWTAALDASDLRDGVPARGEAGETPVLIVRRDGRLAAIHDRCSHRGCSLADGELDGDVIECGCHGSRFRLSDGGIERGPASSPQPAFDTREREGKIDVRLRPLR